MRNRPDCRCGNPRMNAQRRECRECYNRYMAAYMLKRYRRRRAEAIQLLGGKCGTCGTTEDLQFDHRDPDRKADEVTRLFLSGSERKWQAELRACQLLCAPCHQGKTATEQSVEHGGGLSGKKNCPCRPCRDRKNEWTRKRKIELTIHQFAMAQVGEGVTTNG